MTRGPGQRPITQNIPIALVACDYGAERNYGLCGFLTPAARVRTGGSRMQAVLGPDFGDGMRRGTPTNSTSLQPLMGLLNANSPKTWIAGHLLNADLGGSGTDFENLTALTVAANGAHKTFEQHVKRMLLCCRQLDEANPGHPYWYGVRYEVTVDGWSYAATPDPNDMHSYASSHITIEYGFVTLTKPNAAQWAWVTATDPRLAALGAVAQPMVAGLSPNIGNWAPTPGDIKFGPIEIHNEA